MDKKLEIIFDQIQKMRDAQTGFGLTHLAWSRESMLDIRTRFPEKWRDILEELVAWQAAH